MSARARPRRLLHMPPAGRHDVRGSSPIAAQASRDIETADVEPRARTTDFGLVVGVDHYPRFRSLQGAVAGQPALEGQR